jgi:multicomponent Na+:H+ antiporter subunit D
VLGAIAQDDVKRILSFTIVSQIGYMVMGLALFTVAGVAAAVYSMIHHIIVQTSLFLTEGLIEHSTGSSRLTRLGGMVRTAPVLALLFLLPALSLVGIPPFSGFISKLALVDAGVSSEQYAIVTVSLAVSLLTLVSMIRIWAGAFWNPAEDDGISDMTNGRGGTAGGPLFMVMPTVVLVTCGLAVAGAAGTLYSLSERTARDLMEPAAYIQKVLGT